MNVIAKDVKAAGFDPTAWKEELLTLNPWGRGLTIDEANAEFAAARQKTTLTRHAEGKDVWNSWANGMLALKAALEAAGQWAARRGEFAWDSLKGDNEPTQVWLALASAMFSTEALTLHFESEVSFHQSIFPSDAVFKNATFNGYTDFGSATFSGDADFGSATLSGEADFHCATFNSYADFMYATFSGEADFESATFKRPTFLEEVRFNADADFRRAKLEETISFANSIFRQAAGFEEIDSAAAFSFADAKFTQVPSLFGAAFKGILRLDNVATPRYRWTFGYTPDKDATARFRELRRRAGEAQDHDRELEFFAQEVRTGRFHAKGLPSWVPKVWSWRFWFGLGFGALSDFGRSLWRPLLSWLALTVLCAAFFLGENDDMRKARAALAPSGFFSTLAVYTVTTSHALANPPACSIQGREPFASTDAVTEAVQLSLKNALVFNIGSTDSTRRTFGCLFGLEQDGNQQYLSVPVRVSTASTIQALASALLLFLFGLAVRNLLRLK
jgi:hypothetical protein